MSDLAAEDAALDALHLATKRLGEIAVEQSECAAARRQAVAALRALGWSLSQIAHRLDLSKSAVQRMTE